MKKIDSTLASEGFREVMGKFATGVTVVTTRAGEMIHGLTANAFCSVSLEPPLVLVCVEKKANSHDLIIAGRCFAVNFLSAEQQEIAQRFSQNHLQAAERFAEIAFREEVTGAPVFDISLGWLDCKLLASHEGGDHTIFVGEVLALGHGKEKSPLLFFGGRYATIKAEQEL